MEGIESGLPLPEPVNANLFRADAETLKNIERLPETLEEALSAAGESAFIRERLPEQILRGYGLRAG